MEQGEYISVANYESALHEESQTAIPHMYHIAGIIKTACVDKSRFE